MKVTGSHRIEAPCDRVWDALHDPEVLSRTLPGCDTLIETGPDAYEAVLAAGVASIKGTYRATVELSDKLPPDSYRMRASGAGTPGTVSADVQVRLEPAGEATIVHYDADAVVGGMIGGVGQRMLTGVARRTAGEFFRAVERELLTGPVTGRPAGERAATAPSAEPTLGGDVAPPGRVRTVGTAPQNESRGAELAGAAAVGGLLALAGVLVGRRLGRGSRDG
jgi:uncharacterized protein